MLPNSMEFPPGFPPLASIEAMRPVFLIVMGAFLLLIAWRVTRGSRNWGGRMMLAGAMMLCFGYSVVVPLYQSGRMVSLHHLHHYHGEAWIPVFWHCARLIGMNLGWFLFGLGAAMHARLFEISPRPVRVSAPVSSPAHEPVA